MPLEAPDRKWLIIAASALAVAALSWLGRRAPVRKHGWRRLEPSAMHWTGLVLGGGLFLLCLYVRLFVGSARRDAEHQMNVLTGLILAFGVGVAICAWTIMRVRALAFEWQGDTLAWRSGHGDRMLRKIDELTSVRRSVLGWIILSFAEGQSVKLDEHAQGCAQLIERLAEQRPDLLRPSASSGWSSR